MNFIPQPIAIPANTLVPIDIHIYNDIGLAPTTAVYIDDLSPSRTNAPDVTIKETTTNGKITKISVYPQANNGRTIDNLIITVKP